MLFLKNMKVALIFPTEKGDYTVEFNSCFEELKKWHLDNMSDKIIKIQVFIAFEEVQVFPLLEKVIKEKILSDFNDSIVSIIPQAPADSHIAFEVSSIPKESVDRIQKKKIDDVEVIEIEAQGNITILFTTRSNEVIEKAADTAFIKAEKILHSFHMNFANVIRQWNYIGYILENKNRQNYQIFNDIRSHYYANANFINGYPAATGIGMNVQGVIIDFIALIPATNISIIPINNEMQKPAWDYTEKVLIGNEKSKTTPKFERAKLIMNCTDKELFVSGTASIRAELSEGDGDVEKQCQHTIENIHFLTEKVNCHTFKYARVYLKRKNDYERVKKQCEKYFGNAPILYTVADICRDNLLIEIETELTF